MKKIIVGISGATGVQMGARFLQVLHDMPDVETHLVVSQGAKIIFQRETNISVEELEAVISGGARGADGLAARFAATHVIPLVVIAADWKRYGRKAGPIRNTEIVARADAVAAFWDGKSPGTRDTITKARNAGLRVEVFFCGRGSAEGGVMPLL